MPRDNEVLIENAKIAFRNFSGKEGPMNRAGDRNFCILLEPATAKLLEAAGWNVKTLKAKDEDGAEAQPYIQVAVSYNPKSRPPRIILLSARRDGTMSRTAVDEDVVGMLDHAEVENVDVVLNPYEWAVNGNTGIKAYLKTMYMTIRMDPLDMKYEMDDEDIIL